MTTTPPGYLMWPDDFGDAPIACCPVGAPCAFHVQFPQAIRSPLRTPANNAVAMVPPPDPAAIATPAAPAPIIIAPPAVDPPAPADPSAPAAAAPADPAAATPPVASS